MLVGIDVSHDSLMRETFNKPQTGAKSVVGFCASYDPHYMQYHSQIRHQGRGEEFVKDSKELMRNALENYKQKNGAYPKVSSACLIWLGLILFSC